MRNQNRKKTFLIIAAIWLAFWLLNSFSTTAGIKTIPYSEFLRLARDGKVSEVAVSDNVIQGKMFPEDATTDKGEVFQTVRVDGEISEVLEQNGVEYTGKIESNFLSNLFAWIFPVLLFVGIWYFIMKRMTGQQPGFMSLGKNKAKIYVENGQRRAGQIRRCSGSRRGQTGIG